MTVPLRQQISNLATGTSVVAELRVAPVQDNVVFVAFSAATTLANLTGPSGYTKAAERQGDGIAVQLYYKRAGAAESTTITGASSASVALKIHAFEVPDLFITGDPIDVTATDDSGIDAVTMLAAGTTAAVDAPNTLAIAAVATLGGNADFLLVDWSNDYTALSDHETRGLMVGAKVMTEAVSATTTATWTHASAPTTHKAAGVIATFSLDAPVVLAEPTPRRVASGRSGTAINTTGTVDTLTTFPVEANHLYLAFVGASRDSGIAADASIPDSHGGGMNWDLDKSLFIGAARRLHMFRAISGTDLAAASISITTAETACAFWWTVIDVTGIYVSGLNGEEAIRQIATASSAGSTFIETSFAVTPLATNGVIGFMMHGEPERQLVDTTPDVHLLLAESNIVDAGGQRVSVDWFQGNDPTFRWDWASNIHALVILVEVQVDAVIGGTGFPQVDSLTETVFTTNTTSHLVAMPATVEADDLLLMIAAFDGAPTVTNPAGWSELENEANVSHARLVTAKIAVGTEGGTTVDVVTSVIEGGAAQVFRISPWWGTIATGVVIGARATAGGVATNDPPLLAPTSWATEFTLWLAVLTVATPSTALNVTTYPTSYTDGTETDPGTTTQGALVASARRQTSSPSQDPDPFVMSVSAAGSASRVIAVRPSAADQVTVTITTDTCDDATGFKEATLAVSPLVATLIIVEDSGVSYTLAPDQPIILDLPDGDYEWEAIVTEGFSIVGGGTGTFTINPCLTRLIRRATASPSTLD